MTDASKIAERVRTYREKLGLSINDLAIKSGVGIEVLASVEAGEVIPALGVLTKLSRALGQRLGTFMDDQFKPDPIITRAEDLQAAKVKDENKNNLGYSSHSLALGKPDRHMDPFRIEFAADGVDEVSSHEGEELLICVKGEIELAYGDERHVLKPGDTAYYNSVVSHAVRACGTEPATIYGIVYMPF